MLTQERKTFFLHRLFSCVTTRAQWVLDTRLLPDIFFHSRPDSVLKIVGNRVNCFVIYYPKCRVLPYVLGIPSIFLISPIVQETQNIGYTQHHWVFQVETPYSRPPKKRLYPKYLKFLSVKKVPEYMTNQIFQHSYLT